jgi:hypothetical protein
MPLAGLGGARGDLAGEIRIPADPLFEQRDELWRSDYRVRRHAMVRVEGAAVIHRPLADLDIGEADVDPCRCVGHMLTTVRVAMSRTWVGPSKSAISSASTTSAPS